MCSRFYLDVESSEKLKSILEEAGRRQTAITGENTVVRGEAFPSQVIAALAMSKNGQTAAFPMEWGFHRKDGKGLIINTRSETAASSPLFRDSMRERRCLIPASWYYEWQQQDLQQNLFELSEELSPSVQIKEASLSPVRRSRNINKIKHAIRPKGQEVVYLAAIYRYEDGRKLPVCSILTREAAPDIAFIHPRMPVIFDEKTAMKWLDRNDDPAQVMAECRTDMIYQAVKEQSHD
ncbi:MAG: SOS response-associated peptidase family protein [Clostridia bacterium]|nr:SOS response-associated peptidase family protein [Clostridia bacterium]